MNKKAAIIHWTLLGVLLALAIFFTVTKVGQVGIEEKGKFSLDFLEKSYLPLHEKMLGEEMVMKNLGTDAAWKLAEKGGFNGESPCGKIHEFNLWNKEKEGCFPQPNETAAAIVLEKAASKLTERKIEKVYTKETALFWEAPVLSITSVGGSYSLKSPFAVELGYSFEDYIFLEEEAKRLVAKCAGEVELASCLDSQKKEYWKYGSCSEEGKKIVQEGRVVLFCVKSPHLYSLPVGEEYLREKKLVTYNLALDFTSAVPLAVSGLEVKKLSATEYQLEFGVDVSVSSYITKDTNNYTKTLCPSNIVADNNCSVVRHYTLYYTNWPSVAEKVPGKATEIFQDMPTSAAFGYFKKSAAIDVPIGEDCPAEKLAGQAYHCGEKAVYVLEDAELAAGTEYYFGVAAVKEGVEVEIKEMVKS